MSPSIDIIRQMRMATRELARLGRPLVMTGHSAGGHLAACMLATDWPAFDAALPEDLVVAAYAISGLFDLVPLVETSINKALQSRSTPPRGPQARCSGTRRRAEVSMRWSARTKARNISGRAGPSSSAWGAAGLATRFGVVPGANHFTAIAPLADPGSPMVARLKATGGAVAQKALDGRGFGLLRQITLSIKCFE